MLSVNIKPNSNNLIVTINYIDEILFDIKFCPYCGEKLIKDNYDDLLNKFLLSAIM